MTSTHELTLTLTTGGAAWGGGRGARRSAPRALAGAWARVLRLFEGILPAITVAQGQPAKAEVAGGDEVDVGASLTGDEEAYARLVRRHQGAAARWMWRFSRDPGVHEELVQNVFVEAYFSLGSYRGEGAFEAWLRVIATRVGYAHWKERDRRRRRIARPVEEWDPAPGTPAGEMSPDRAGAILFGLLARLGSEDRIVLTLMYFEECSTADIAKRMGWNGAMTKMRAYRARRRLKSILEKERYLEAIGWTG